MKKCPARADPIVPVSPTSAPAVDFALKGDDDLLKLIHRMLYRTPGKATIIKKNIPPSGLSDDTDRSKPRDLLTAAFGPTLNMLLDLFDLPRGSGEEGKKEAKIERIMAFLEARGVRQEESKGAAAAKRESRGQGAAAKRRRRRRRPRLPVVRPRSSDDAAAIKAELEKMAARQAAL